MFIADLYVLFLFVMSSHSARNNTIQIIALVSHITSLFDKEKCENLAVIGYVWLEAEPSQIKQVMYTYLV